MKLLRNPILIVVGLLALALLVMPGCTDKPKAPSQDIEPNTIITTYGINTLPDSATYFSVTVYWRASDADGQAELYRYWVGALVVDDTLKTTSTDAFASIRLNFATAADVYDFNVQARDNEGVWDSTPATIRIDMANVRHGTVFGPQTVGSAIPDPGGLTSSGVHFIINATDIDGLIPEFEYAVDNTATWTTVPATVILNQASTLELDITGLALGPHIVYVRAIDNMGNIDESPLSISFVVVDYLRPDLALVSGIIPNAFYFLPQGGTTVDLNTAWFGDATWYFSSLQYRYAIDDTSNWSAWQTPSTATVTGLVAGGHHFYLEAMDQAGHSSFFEADFGVGQLTGDRGILLVNGIDWTQYGAECGPMYQDHGPYGSHSIDFWDLFEGASSYYPANLDSAYIGAGLIPGDTLGHYSSMIMIMNEYANSGPSDLEQFNSMFPLLMSYLNGGGNILLATRFGADFVKGDLATYGLSAGNSLTFDQIGVNHRTGGLVAAVEGLVNITGTGSWSLSDLLAPSSDAAVTKLFDTPDYPTAIGGIMVQPTGKGKFGFIAGRPYRFTHAPMAADFDYILTHYFGEQ